MIYMFHCLEAEMTLTMGNCECSYQVELELDDHFCTSNFMKLQQDGGKEWR